MLPFSRAVCVALCLSHVAYAFPKAFNKRATSSSTTIDTINIPILFDESGRYVIPVGMSPGADEQHFNFTLATSIDLTSVAGTECGTCSSISLYNQSASDSAKSLQSSDSVSLLGGSYSGSVIKENCTMATTGSPWAYENQTIVVAKSQNNGIVFGNGVSGLLGLGTNRFASSTSTSSGSGNFSANFDDTIFSRWLDTHPDADAFQFGMDISPPVITPTSSSSQATASPTSANAGTLHWLKPDASAYYTQQVTFKTVEANSSIVYASGDGQPDWSVMLDGWSVKSGSSEVTSTQEMVTSVDSYYTDIYFPLQQAELLNDIISGSAIASGISSLGSQSQAWTVPCNSQFTFTVNINNQTFMLDESILVVPISDGVCVSGIEGWTDSSVEQYLFGALFLSQFYIIFSVGRNGTDTVGFAPKVVIKKASTTGAIVGGTIGGAAGVFLIGLAAFFYIRSRRDRAMLKDTVAMVEEHKAAHAVEPYMVGVGAAQTSPQRSEFMSGRGSPGVSMPLLGVQPEDDFAPPSYEATQGAGSEAGSQAVTIGTSKGEYIRSTAAVQAEAATSSSANLSQNQEGSVLAPNRAPEVYNIEE